MSARDALKALIIADIRTPPKVEPPPEPTQPERGKSLRRPAEGW